MSFRYAYLQFSEFTENFCHWIISIFYAYISQFRIYLEKKISVEERIFLNLKIKLFVSTLVALLHRLHTDTGQVTLRSGVKLNMDMSNISRQLTNKFTLFRSVPCLHHKMSRHVVHVWAYLDSYPWKLQYIVTRLLQLITYFELFYGHFFATIIIRKAASKDHIKTMS